MGLTSSRTIIPVKEAQVKLGHPTLIKVEKAYARLTDSTIGDVRPLDFKTFQRNFLEAFPLMPKMLVEALFDAFGASRRGAVTLEEFICAVAVMHTGNAPEQLRMLFEVYDFRRAGYIEIDSMRRLLDTIYGRDYARKVDNALEWLFVVASRHDGMDAEEFITRLKPVVDYRNSAAAAQAEPLLQWFRALCTRILFEPDPAVVALEQKYNPDRDLNKVAMKYKLSPIFTDILYRRHAAICRRSSTNSLDVQEWLSVIGYLIPEALGRRVFQFFAQSGGLAWTVADFITFLCVCVLDSRQEHVSVMFQLFDVDLDGLLLEDEVAAMLQNLASYHAHRVAGGGGSSSSSGSSSIGSNNGGGGGGQHRGHRHHHHNIHHQGHHQLDQASLLLGLRKLGYENVVMTDANPSSAAGCDSCPATTASYGGDSCSGNSYSITKMVARRLLKDMRATSDKYVAFPTPAVGHKEGYFSSIPSSLDPVQQQQQQGHLGAASSKSTTSGGMAPAMAPAGVVDEGVDRTGGEARGAGVERHGGGEDRAELGGLTFAGFMAWSSVHGGRMMLVKDLVYACLADFGMRPAKAVQEREVVMEIFRRHQVALADPDGFPYGPEGTRWAVINAQWWAQWREYARLPAETERHARAHARAPPPERLQNGQQLVSTSGNLMVTTAVGSSSRSADPSPSSTAAPSSASSSSRSRTSSRVFGSTSVLGSGSKGSRLVGGSASGRSAGIGGGGGGNTGSVVSSYLSAPSSVVTQAARPVQIPNQPLLEHGGSRRLLRTARIGQDFEVIPPKAWDALQSWYEGGPPLERRVINYHGRLELELFPMSIKVASCDIKGKPRQYEREMLLSKVDKVSDLSKQLAEANKVEPERARLWNYLDRVDWKKQHVLSPGDTLEEAKLMDGQLVLLEISQQDGAWPRSQLQSMLEAEEEEAQAQSAASADGHGRRAKAIGDGLVGLGNLGNTCYINSSVQCLSHTPLLTEYFLSGSYVNDVNVENKLGLQGRLAHVYADLVNELWSPTKKTVTPKSFKNELAKFNDLFGGHDQHDAQELLAFLLNGLNEDLNRIADKPYIEQPDSDGRPDAELADIWWKNHLRREFSIVVALFAGQFKSLLVCRECGYESARFEPFMFLQLPLPEDTERSVVVIVVLLDGARCPAKVSLRLPKTGRVSDLIMAVVETLNAPPPERTKRISQSASEATAGAKTAGVTVSGQEGQSSSAANAREDGLPRTGETPEGVVSEDGWVEAPSAAAAPEEGSDDDEEGDSFEEERRFYTRLRLQCEDLAVVDINAHKIFSTVSPDRTLQSIRESEMFYVYELERDIYAEQQAAAAAAAAEAAEAAAAVTAVKLTPAPSAGTANVSPEGGEGSDSVSQVAGERASGKTVAAMQGSSSGEEVRKMKVARVAEGAEDVERKSAGAETSDGRIQGRDTVRRLKGDGEGGGEDHPVAAGPAAFSVSAAASAAAPVTAEGTGETIRVEHQTNGVVHDGASEGHTNEVELQQQESAVSDAEPGSSETAGVDSPEPPSPQPMKPIRMPARLFAVLHRRLEKSRNYLASPYRLEVFGTPLVCRVVPMTGRQLYDKLYRRFHRFLRLKAGTVAHPCGGSAASVDWGYGRDGIGAVEREGDYYSDVRPCMGSSEDEKCPQSVRATSKWVAAGEVNRWGFRLRLVESNGYACSRCSWMESCVGCFIRPNDEPCPVRPGDSVGVDWHISVIKEHYDTSEALSCLLHSSIAHHKDIEARPLSLEKCLDTFTQQEDIKEGYCSRCREFRNASKKMDVWRLPPILAIQLKRFQYTQYSRRKLRNNVLFPVNGLDLSPYVVTDSSSGEAGVVEGEQLGGSEMAAEDINQRQEPPRDHPKKTAQGHDSSSPTMVSEMAARTGTAVHGSAESVQGGFVFGDRHDASRPNGSTKVTEASSAVTTMTSLGDGWEKGATKAAQSAGERVYTSEDAAVSSERAAEPVVLAGAQGKGKEPSSAASGAVKATDSALSHGGSSHDNGGGVEVGLPEPGMSHPGVIGANGGRGGSLYDLYAVVHHLGALSSGHYVASVKSPSTSKWHYFNDNQVTEMGEDELGSSSSSAYILFYMRRDCMGLRIEDVYPSGPPKTVEEVEALMLHRDASKCSIM